MPREGELLRGASSRVVDFQLSKSAASLALLLRDSSDSGFVGPMPWQHIKYAPRYNTRSRNLNSAQKRVASCGRPSQLVSTDFIDLSGLRKPRVYALRNLWRPVYTTVKGVILPFPLGTHGFLYATTSSDDTYAAAPGRLHVRFRVTSKPEPSSFAAGKDLVRPDGVPWTWSLQIPGVSHDTPAPSI
jgi:hypothetical protein